MFLKDKLLEDLKTAMKLKDVIKKNTVQMVRSAVLQVEKDQKITLDDDGIIEIIMKELKKRLNVLPEYKKSGREDLIDNLNKEIDILKTYLPKQLSENEIEAIVKDCISEFGAVTKKDIGKIMKLVMSKVKGKTDGKTVNKVVKKIL
ncbi:MAG: GatB/YqeY domain-containing protein [Clostridiales bacterium]